MADNLPTEVQTSASASRYEKSLGLMATRFVALLQNAEGGSLDLKKASDILNVRQKRRIYDITNVLEGIGLIEKKSKNVVQWKGSLPKDEQAQGSEVKNRLNLIKRDIECMKKLNAQLDLFVGYVETNLKNIREDIDTKDSIYVAYTALNQVFSRDKSVILVRAPDGTVIELKNNDHEYCLSFDAPEKQQIDVFLVDQLCAKPPNTDQSNNTNDTNSQVAAETLSTQNSADFNSQSPHKESLDQFSTPPTVQNFYNTSDSRATCTPLKKIHYENPEDEAYGLDGSEFLISLSNRSTFHEQLNVFYESSTK